MKRLLILMALAGFHPPGLLSAPLKPAVTTPRTVSANVTPATAATPVAASSTPMAGAASIETLLLRSLEALGANDSAALSRLTVDRGDFLQAYPHFAGDTSSARRGFALGYFLADNRKLLGRILDQSGGHRLPLVRFTVSGPVVRYGDAELHRGLRIWVARDSSEVELKFLKSVLHTGQAWKIWSFSDD